MLQFILGGVGSGKTTRIEENIKSYSSVEGAGITLIVPEQFSFTCQKRILALIGAEKMQRTDVQSFTSLGEKLIGKPAFYERRRLSETGAAVIMALTLKQVKDELKLYSSGAERPSSVREFLALSSEMKQNLVTPDALRAAADAMGEGLLKAKLGDIALILEKYDENVRNSYFNPEDLLSELCRAQSLDAYFDGRIVFIDSFRGFTAAEYMIIERILVCAKEVYISLCTDDLENADDITDFFAKTKNTASRIAALAKKNGVPVQKPQYLSKGGKYCNFPPHFERYRSPELNYLEKAMRSPSPATYDEECRNITLCRASGVRLECEFAAASIKKLIREENYRYRDIAVIARNIEAYRVPLTTALKKFGIKVYEDYRKGIDVSPVINTVGAALRACADSYSADSMMRYIKTGLAGLDNSEISELDNYCYTCRISGSKWLKDWTANPAGFVDTESTDMERLKAQLDGLNRLRNKVITPLAELKESFRGGTDGGKAAENLWSFLEKISLSKNVRRMALSLAEDGEEYAVQELGRMWSVLASLIDEMHSLLSGVNVTAKSFADMFDLMVSSKTIGDLPHGLDDITIGSADRIRVSSPRAVFVIGANEGVFPPEIKIVSSLTVRERLKLEQYGISLANTAEWKLAEENLIAYCSLCCAKEKLFVSCTSSQMNGEALQPCAFYNKIKECIPSCTEVDAADLDGLYYIEEKQPAFEQLAKSAPGVLRETLTDYFSRCEDYSGRIASLQRAGGGRNFRILSPETAASLFGRKMLISPSAVEKYHKCAFSYFCRYGIKAKPRATAELDRMQMGNVNHKVLERVFSENSRETLLGLSDGELRGKINEIMDEYLADVLGSPDDRRLLFLYDMLRDSLFEVIKKLISDFEYSSFYPADFELEIGGEIPAYSPAGDDSIAVTGKIDRVDTASDGTENYYRVVDYKTYGKKFELGETAYGLNLQMLIYLFALWQNSGTRYGAGAVPAGVLYMAAADKYTNEKGKADSETVEKNKLKAFKVSGILLKDSHVIRLMKNGDGGLILPAGFNSNGEITGVAVNMYGLKKLNERTDRLLIQMAEHLRGGGIEALPFRKSDGEFFDCKFCDYRCVCGFEESMDFRQLEVKKCNDAISELETQTDAQEKEGGEDDVDNLE